MNVDYFDVITSNLSKKQSRRVICRLVTGGILGTALARLGLAEAVAGGCKKLRKPCSSSNECCGSLVCKKANAQGSCGDNRKRCCVKLGDRCDGTCECCGGDNICNGGVCRTA